MQNLLVAHITSRSKRLQNIVEGRAVLIGRGGEIYREVLRRHGEPDSDIDEALREADCNLEDMKFAFLEADGRLSVLKESDGKVLSGNVRGG